MGVPTFMFHQGSEKYTPPQKEGSFCKGGNYVMGNIRHVMKYCTHGYFLDQMHTGSDSSDRLL